MKKPHCDLVYLHKSFCCVKIKLSELSYVLNNATFIQLCKILEQAKITKIELWTKPVPAYRLTTNDIDKVRT